MEARQRLADFDTLVAPKLLHTTAGYAQCLAPCARILGLLEIQAAIAPLQALEDSCRDLLYPSDRPTGPSTNQGGVMIVGLTGGIATGKSTVATILRELGAVVIDADLVARDVVEPGSEGLAAIVAAFGDAVLTSNGDLDRPTP